MGLWGASDSDESKPKNLTAAEKKEVFANTTGWVREAGGASQGNDNTSANPEVLVAIGGLSASIGGSPGKDGVIDRIDTDEDGWFDATEIFFGSSPSEAESAPRFQLKSNVLANGQVQFMFPAELGSQYVIQTSNDLKTWITLEKLILGSGNIVTERFSTSGKSNFFRIKKQ